jgi:arylsulfatase A-like enzyme
MNKFVVLVRSVMYAFGRNVIGRVPWLKKKVQEIRSTWRLFFSRQRRKKHVAQLADKYSLKFSKSEPFTHVILIVVDVLRPDHMQVYGYRRNTTPFLSKMATESAVFERTIATSPWTYPSVASMLTGLYPHEHGGVFTEDPRCQMFSEGRFPRAVRADILSLPEMLAARGLATLFISSNPLAELAVSGWFQHQVTFDAPAEKHLEQVIAFIGAHESEGSFTYCHLNDLHQPVRPPKPYRDIFGRIPDIKDIATWSHAGKEDFNEPDFKAYRAARIQLYDSAIRYVDDQVKKLLERLSDSNVLDRTLLVITADHGEEFWDHWEMEKELFFHPKNWHGVDHAHNLFQELIHVPLMIRGPGIEAGRIKSNCSLVDLTPTVTRLCGVETSQHFTGRDLFEPQHERAILSEEIGYGYEKKAVLHKGWKLINSEGDGVELLFDLSRDPREKQNFSSKYPDKLRELRRTLESCLQGKRGSEPLQDEAVDDRMIRRLRELGYIE